MSKDQIIRAVQNYCADILASGREWNEGDAKQVAGFLNYADDPFALFRELDERTGDWRIGYRTQDGREWFPILRQMRNRRECGLFAYMGR